MENIEFKTTMRVNFLKSGTPTFLALQSLASTLALKEQSFMTLLASWIQGELLRKS